MNLLDMRAAQKHLALPRSTFYRYRAAGQLPEPDLKISRRAVFYQKKTLDDWLAHHGARSAKP